jgi:hypothetical protein
LLLRRNVKESAVGRIILLPVCFLVYVAVHSFVWGRTSWLCPFLRRVLRGLILHSNSFIL